MECSAVGFQVLFRFCPAIRHWPDRDSFDGFCAQSAETNKRTLINAVTGNDTLRLLIDICIVLLELNCDYARPHFFNKAIPLRGNRPHVGKSRIWGWICENCSAALAQELISQFSAT